MNYNPTRRALLARQRDARRCRFAAGLGAGQAEAALLGRVLGAGHPRRNDEDVRRRDQDDFTFEPYYGGKLFKQGTELVALQRGNLEMGNIAPQDISKQIPAWSVLTSAYLFRDAAHLQDILRQRVGAEFKKMAEDQLGVHMLGPTYFGARQVGLKPDKKINDAGGHGRHQAAHAGRRRLAVPRHGARRQSDADGLCRGLYRPADRRDRRPGQSAAQRREHEVLRGDVADRADLASGRLRPADRLQEGLGRHGRREAGQVPGRRRRGHRLEHREASGAREANWSSSSRARA